MNWNLSRLKDVLKKNHILAVLSILLILSFLNVVEHSFREGITDPVYHKTVEYLDRTSQKALISFGAVSAIKIALTVGKDIPFLGKVSQNVLDYTNLAWYITFFALVVLELLKIILFLAHHLEFKLLSLLIISLILLRLSIQISRLQWFKKMARVMTSFTVMFSLLVLVFLPLSIMAADWVSKKTSSPLIDSANKELTELDEKLKAREKAYNEKMQSSKPYVEKEKTLFDKFIAGPMGKSFHEQEKMIEGTKEEVKNVITKIETHSSVMTKKMIHLIVGYLLECIIFPLLFILIFYLFGRLAVREYSRGNTD